MDINYQDLIGHIIDGLYLVDKERKIIVTASIGATMAAHDDNPESIVKRADRLLYSSKQDGRNCYPFG